MFELLFKLPRAAFARGAFVLASPWPRWLLVALVVGAALLIALAIAWHVRRAGSRLSLPRLAILWALEAAAVALVALLLWRPAIALSELKPQQNLIAVLLDDSSSMRLPEHGETREAAAIRTLQGGLLDQLRTRYQARLYRFGAHLTRDENLSPAAATPAAATHIGIALRELLEQTSGVPLGAVILLSDGADNSGGIDRAAMAALTSRRIPVYTVGFGAEQVSDDLELDEVSVPARALTGARVSALVRFHQRGFAGRRSILSVRDGSRVLASHAVTLAPDGRAQSETILFNVGEAGARALTFSLEPLREENNHDNNAVTRLIQVLAEPRRILYFEGEPRWEYKFIRRAEDEDPAVQLVSMLRTTENKIYRQGIHDPMELASGFPTRPEDLFVYDALIIGSIDAGYFSPAQQDLIRQFVDRRGGGLLLLGGRQSLSDGVWGGSQTADLLPVVLPPAHATFRRDHATVSLTAAGADSVICRLLDDREANVERWRKLPYLMDYQDPGTAKPGAIVLAEMHAGERTMPLLITENYGRGRTAVLATGGTWRWQMSSALGDTAHRMFWQQLLRWLVSDTRGRVMASVPSPLLYDEAQTELIAEVRDQNYEPIADAHVTAHVIGPGGSSAALDLEAVPGAVGRYHRDWTASSVGTYIAEISAQRGTLAAERDVVSFARQDGIAEQFHTEQNRELLQLLASRTGGRYFKPEDVAALPAAVPYSPAGVTVQQLVELWNMPINFIVLVLLRGADWLLRRRWGIV